MNSKRLVAFGIALALGLVWTTAPALAQQTTGEKMKDKAESATEKTKDKAVEVKDKVKDKAVELKDKAKSKMQGMSASNKADTMAMQQALKDKGFDPGPADGKMGPRTRAALRDYQKKEGLNPTGRWDEQTGEKLGVRMSRTTPPDTMTPSASPAAPPATPEDKTAPPAKRNSP